MYDASVSEAKNFKRNITVRISKMGFGDSSAVDRHDHNSVIEGNVVRAANDDVDEQRIVVLLLCVMIGVLVLAFGIKYAVDKCIERVVRAVRRDDAQPL